MGRRALSESFLISSGGAWSTAVTGTVPLDCAIASVCWGVSVVVLIRLAGGDVGGEVTVSLVVIAEGREVVYVGEKS